MGSNPIIYDADVFELPRLKNPMLKDVKLGQFFHYEDRLYQLIRNYKCPEHRYMRQEVLRHCPNGQCLREEWCNEHLEVTPITVKISRA